MKKIIVLFLTVLALSPLAAGGKQEAPPTASADGAMAWMEGPSVLGLPGVNPIKVTGNIITAGSSTVF